MVASIPGEDFVERRVTVPGHGIGLTPGGTGSLAAELPGVGDGSLSFETSCPLPSDPIPFEVTPQPWVVFLRGGRFRVEGLPACDRSVRIDTGGRRYDAGFSMAAAAETHARFERSRAPYLSNIPHDHPATTAADDPTIEPQGESDAEFGAVPTNDDASEPRRTSQAASR